ncbi:MAG: hypothetical protein PVJ66_10545, partial [Gammaproteobacteria bacterium]
MPVLRGLLAVLLLHPGWLAAQEPVSGQDLDALRAQLVVLENVTDAGDTLQARRESSGRRKRLQEIRGEARECTTRTQTELASLTARRAALGQPSTAEDPEVSVLRGQLDAAIARGEKRRVACEQIVQQSQVLLDRIEERQQAALVARLFARGPSTPAVLVDAIAQPREWSRLVSGFLAKGSGWERLTPDQHGIVLAVFVLLGGAGVIWQRRWLARHASPNVRRYLAAGVPWLLSVGSAAALLLAFQPAWPPTLVGRLALGVLAWLILDVIQQAWLAGRRSAGLKESDARSLLRWFRLLLALAVAGGLMITAEVVIGLPDPHYFLLRTTVAWLLVIGLVWSTVLLGRIPGMAGSRFLRALLVLAVLVTAIAETLGFRNLSIYLLLGFSGTAAGI